MEEVAKVQFVGVSKTYDGTTFAVRNINLSVRPGELITLLGPSGSGKTTLLMMLAGFLKPTEGAIRVGGIAIEHTAPSQRNLGMVFQNYALFPHMSVAENVAFPLAMRRVAKPDTKRRVSEALELVRLSAFADRSPQQLSGGQQQRVALARAIIHRPELVLMDEPLGALDKQLREQLQTEIRNLQKQLGLTVIYVTHDQNEALSLSDRIAVFNKGEIEQVGVPYEIYSRPVSRFVASFVGATNLLPCRLDTANASEKRYVAGDVTFRVPHAINDEQCEATLSIRPEDIVIGSGTNNTSNRHRARICDLTFLGDHCRVVVETSHGLRLSIKSPVSSLDLRINGQIEIGWNDDAVQLLFR